MSVPSRIRREVRRSVRLAGERPTEDPLRDGQLDSLALEQLVVFVEETFRVQIQDEDTVRENFESIEALAGLIERKRGR